MSSPIVLVHGAWGGAWSWNKLVIPLLREAGQRVYPVTLTGLGERSHLATPETNLDTHIQDVVNVLYYEDLHDVTLVGHSYGGMVITGVADRAPERLRQLVYLDAAVPGDGQSIADLSDPSRRAQLLAATEREGDGWRIPVGPVPADQPAEITTWATPRRVQHPLQCFLQPIKLTRGETKLPRTFVNCALNQDPNGPQAARARQIKESPGWKFIELQTGHNLHYSAPKDTAKILLELV